MPRKPTGNPRGGSKAGAAQSQAGAAALGIEPLVAGEASRLVRVRCPEASLAWFESLTPAVRGYLVMEAHSRARQASALNPEEARALNRLRARVDG